jgi:hypothetical protein
VYGAILSFSTTEFEVETFEKLVGLGCFCAWVTVWQYFQWND